MALQQSSPAVKLEASPAESFMSLPGDNYPSLFASSTPSPSTITPSEIMTPESIPDDKHSSQLSVISEELDMDNPAPEDDEDPSEKKSKKRKSWGQVLPQPKTNLPPRKRAKTADEKEQRRVERVLRNRRAAQSSRERKRLEVEALEQRNKELETQLSDAHRTNLMLVEELKRFRQDSVVTSSPSALASLRNVPITLSQELFSPQDKSIITPSDPATAHLVKYLQPIQIPTVNPASLSPELSPVSDQSVADPTVTETQSSDEALATSPDLTQHPAEVLSDLQCHKSAKVPKPIPDPRMRLSPPTAWALQLRTMSILASAILSACRQPLTQIAMSLEMGFSLLPTPQLLTTIIWLVTLPLPLRTNHPLSNSISMTSSTTTQTTSPPTSWQRVTMLLRTTASILRSPILRLELLENILSCSPNLARPLKDATMEALRLVSEGCDNQIGEIESGSRVTRNPVSDLTRCLSGINLPSREVLITLLWALKAHEGELEKNRRNGTSARFQSGAAVHQPSVISGKAKLVL